MNHGINGAHFLLYSTNADADRAFFRDCLGLSNVDVGGGWLIFALPPGEIAVHPGDGEFVQRHAEHTLAGTMLYFMCDDIHRTVASLAARGVTTTPIETADWGHHTLVPLPSGSKIGLYQPLHARAT